MHRSILALTFVLALTACKKEQQAAPDSTAEELAEAAPDEGPSADAEPDAPSEPVKRAPLTKAKVDKFYVYRGKEIATYRQLVQEAQAVQKRTEGRSDVLAGLDWVRSSPEIAKRFDEGLAAARKETGLEEGEVEDLRELVFTVVTGRELYAQMEKGSVDAMRAQLAAAGAHATPEQRAEMEKSLAEMELTIKNMRDQTEARAKFGDEAVDAVIARQAELSKQIKDGFELGQGG